MILSFIAGIMVTLIIYPRAQPCPTAKDVCPACPRCPTLKLPNTQSIVQDAVDKAVAKCPSCPQCPTCPSCPQLSCPPHCTQRLALDSTTWQKAGY